MRYALYCVIALNGLLGCGDSTPDPNPDAAVVPVDAPPTACADPADCPCFSNDDCPPTHACSTAQGDPVCLEGPRGTAAAGEPCTGEADCASALCIDGPDDALLCSETCSTSDTCPTPLPRCVDLGGVGLCARQP